MTRKVKQSQKARGKIGTVNGHNLVIRVPHGELGVAEVEANVRRLVGDLRSYNFDGWPTYVKVIAQCMGIHQDDYPCCYGPQMPHSISKSVKAT